MAQARIELYKDGDHMAIVTTAENESDFWESFCELVGGMISEDVEAAHDAEPDPSHEAFPPTPNYGNDWEFQLRYWLPQATEIICKLRGYKTGGVREERRLISGWTDPPSRSKRHEIGPEGASFVRTELEVVAEACPCRRSTAGC